jgi:hypothetical protein
MRLSVGVILIKGKKALLQLIECFEGQKMEFKSPVEFPKLKMRPVHKKIIKEAIELANK